MGDALLDRAMMLRVRRAAGDRLATARRGKLRAAIEFAVFRPR